MAGVCVSLQAERVMEALELYRSESRKMEEHQIACQSAGKQLSPPKANPVLVAFGNVSVSFLFLIPSEMIILHT